MATGLVPTVNGLAVPGTKPPDPSLIRMLTLLSPLIHHGEVGISVGVEVRRGDRRQAGSGAKRSGPEEIARTIAQGCARVSAREVPDAEVVGVAVEVGGGEAGGAVAHRHRARGRTSRPRSRTGAKPRRCRGQLTARSISARKKGIETTDHQVWAGRNSRRYRTSHGDDLLAARQALAVLGSLPPSPE